MSSPVKQLKPRFQEALSKAFGGEFADTDPLIRPCQDRRFGDYQCNVAMSLARSLRRQPRQIAAKIVENLHIEDMCEEPQIAGAGFINLTLKVSWLADQLTALSDDERLGVERACGDDVETVVVDFSSPNIAKQMHVGHLRSTILGDVISRVLEFVGHRVIRQNHIGDWGTQFGMLIAHLEDRFEMQQLTEDELHISDMEQFYRQAHDRFQSDPAFAERARQQVVLLQQGDAKTLQVWKAWRAESLRHCQQLYDRLGVRLDGSDVRGESDYNHLLESVVEDLLQQGIAQEDAGAICVFLDGFVRKDGQPLPLIIQKSDGGFLYATTDLAALRYRVHELKADRIIYVTDARQSLHFQQIFALADKAGWSVNPDTNRKVRLEHVAFGSILGEDNKPLKTRSGENVKLEQLLDEAVERARKIVDEKNPQLPQDRRRQIAETIGMAAIKYGDLSQNRISDYVFSFDKMLAMEGNTAPYLLYAYARIRSIGRKGRIDFGQVSAGQPVILEHETEVTVGKKLLELPEVINDLADSLKPNLLTTYLFELSQAFTGFYENCPVLKAQTRQVRDSRLRLCELTARTLKCGLNVLGIEPLEQM